MTNNGNNYSGVEAPMDLVKMSYRDDFKLKESSLNSDYSNDSLWDYFSNTYLKQETYFRGNANMDTSANVNADSLMNPVTPGIRFTENAPIFNEMAMIKTITLTVMFVVSLIGNSATLIQMFRMRRRKSTINTLILHLATADLFVTFFCNVTDAVWAATVQWYAGNFLCKILKFLQVFSLYLSTYMIVIIALDRCMAILDPMSRNKAPKRVKFMIAFAWLISAFFSLPQLYIFRVRRGPYEEKFLQCVTFGAYQSPWQERLYTCLSVLFLFIVPLAIMVIAYMLIFCTIAKKSRDLQREESELEASSQEMLSRGPVRGQLFRKAKVKSLRMTALIVFAFICCWTPYYVVFIKFVFTQRLNPKVGMWIFFCGMANSMVNPLIYGAFHACARRRKKPPCPISFRQRNQSASPSSHPTRSYTTEPSSSATTSNSRTHPPAMLLSPITCNVHCECHKLDI